MNNYCDGHVGCVTLKQKRPGENTRKNKQTNKQTKKQTEKIVVTYPDTQRTSGLRCHPMLLGKN